MSIHFMDVNQETIITAKTLRVSNEQKGLVESVEESYLESLQCAYWKPVLIVDEKTNIGFAMYGLYPELPKVELWLDRFFIDQRYQGKGYAKKALYALLEEMERNYGKQPIYLSVYPQNTVAIKIYQSIGFVFTNRLDTLKERIMVLETK